MKVGGGATVLSALAAGMPSYGQTKFNVINYSIIHTTSSSVSTITCGILCLVTILSGLAGPIINGLPRFLLAGLLVYSGAGFLYEKLFEGRKHMTTFSFCIVWFIFIVNFLWEFFVVSELSKTVAPLLPGLLVVFILGIILAAFEFIAAFMTKAPPIDIFHGVETCSSALRPQLIEERLGAMSSWYAVLPLQGMLSCWHVHMSAPSHVRMFACSHVHMSAPLHVHQSAIIQGLSFSGRPRSSTRN